MLAVLFSIHCFERQLYISWLSSHRISSFRVLAGVVKHSSQQFAAGGRLWPFRRETRYGDVTRFHETPLGPWPDHLMALTKTLPNELHGNAAPHLETLHHIRVEQFP